MTFIRTDNPFTNLRQYGFSDPLGHDLAMCQDFIDAETQHAALLTALENIAVCFASWETEQFDETMDAAEANLAKIEGGTQ